MPLTTKPKEYKNASSLAQNVARLDTYFPLEIRPETPEEAEKRGGSNRFLMETLQSRYELREPLSNASLTNHSKTAVAILIPEPKDELKALNEAKEKGDEKEIKRCAEAFQKRIDKNNRDMRSAIQHLHEIENKETKTVPEIKEPTEIKEPVEVIRDKKTGIVYNSNECTKYTAYQEPSANQNQPTQGIQNVLYFSEKAKVSTLATDDLISWIDDYFNPSLKTMISRWFGFSPTLDENLIREIVAQVLLRLKTLHSNNKINRDIKFENFLVHVIKKRFFSFEKTRVYIELADIDTIADASIQYIGTFTPPLLAPECTKPYDCTLMRLAQGKSVRSIDQKILDTAEKDNVPILVKNGFNQIFIYGMQEVMRNGKLWEWTQVTDNINWEALPFNEGKITRDNPLFNEDLINLLYQHHYYVIKSDQVYANLSEENRKSVDCYAIGCELLKRFHRYLNARMRDELSPQFLSNLKNLAEGLGNRDYRKRLTIDGCDLFLMSVDDKNKIEKATRDKAIKEKTPILIREKDQFFIYGECKNGEWGYTPIRETQDLTNLNQLFNKEQGKLSVLERTNQLFTSSLFKTLKEGHAPIGGALNHPFFGQNPEAYHKSVREKHRAKSEFIGSYYRSRKDFYPNLHEEKNKKTDENNSFFILSEELRNIRMQAASLEIQMEWVRHPEKYKDHEQYKNTFKDSYHTIFVDQDCIAAARNTLQKLKASLRAYKNKEPRDILESLAENVREAENFLSSTEIESYFAILEKDESYADEKNDKHLFKFLNNRSDEQKRIDFRAACLNLENYINTLPEQNQARLLLQSYRDELNKQKAHFPLYHLPRMTELTYRFLYKAQNTNDPHSDANHANNRRGAAVSKEISTTQYLRVLAGIGGLVLGGVLTTAAVLVLMASFGAAAPLSAALGAFGISVTTSAIIAAIGVGTAASAVSYSVAAGAGLVGLGGVALGLKGVSEAVKCPYVSYKAKRISKMSYFFNATLSDAKKQPLLMNNPEFKEEDRGSRHVSRSSRPSSRFSSINSYE
ncbi:MAG TPA: hypothetical protein VLI69_08920 [Gammaproteobacteria bacterium]|nr:hypothetical protein [Gammaproteobacteria bacterium]